MIVVLDTNIVASATYWRGKPVVFRWSLLPSSLPCLASRQNLRERLERFPVRHCLSRPQDQEVACSATVNYALSTTSHGQRTLFDLDRQILQNNLYGVDLNDEAIQICQLSLWIKTAARGKQLTSLAQTIREGKSVGNGSVRKRKRVGSLDCHVSARRIHPHHQGGRHREE